MMQQVVIATAKGEYSLIPGATGAALVSSKTTAGGWHVVKCGRCDCQGFEYRGRCAHLDAIACYQRQAAVRQELEVAAWALTEAAAAVERLSAELAALTGGAPVPALPAPAEAAPAECVVDVCHRPAVNKRGECELHSVL